jgi:diguanylate cyclase (GGDEF)-like protein
MVVRLGGDEFAVLQKSGSECGAAVSLAERLIDEVSAPYCVEDKTILINISVGIAIAPDCGGGDDLLRAVDEASYEAKRKSKGLYRLAKHKTSVPLP